MAQAKRSGDQRARGADRTTANPHLSHTEIFELLKNFYKRFYFRRQKIAPLVAEMIKSPQMMRRWMASNWLERLSKCNRMPVNYTTGGDETDRLTV